MFLQESPGPIDAETKGGDRPQQLANELQRRTSTSASAIVIATLCLAVRRCHGTLSPPIDHVRGVSTSGFCKAAAPDVAVGSPRALKQAGSENPEVP
jgi:hypothetical protein